jgi:hypothetical protein
LALADSQLRHDGGEELNLLRSDKSENVSGESKV